MARLLSLAKQLAIPQGSTERTIPLGLLSGIRLKIDLQSQSQVYFGLNERELSPWFERFSKQAVTAIDVGGAQGYYTLYWLLKTGVQKVFTFEPDRACLAEMQSNLLANGKAKDPRLELSTQFVGDGQAPNTFCLDALVPQIKFPCIVKMDIEGAEIDALQSCPQLIEKDVQWIVETHTKAIDAQCVQLFQEAGYSVKRIHAAWWRLFVPELRPAEFNSWIVASREDLG